MRPCVVLAAGPALVAVASEQHDVLYRCRHQERETGVLHFLRDEMAGNRDCATHDAENERPPIAMMFGGSAKDEEIRQKSDGQQRSVESFASEETDPRAGEETAEEAQTGRANRALQDRQQQRPELKRRARGCSSNLSRRHDHAPVRRTGIRPRLESGPGSSVGSPRSRTCW